MASFVAAHPDLVLLAVLLVIAASVRATFLLRAPLFVRRDSLAYLQTGYELARGQGFDLPLRRTPLYPLVIGGVVWSLGEDLRSLAFAQHLLALVTVAGTYFLGKLMFGRVAGFVAGLLVAISGPLLIYEHYILAEALFIPLLVMGLLLTVLAMRRESAGLYLAGGVVLALAALSRPIGQALVPVAPLAILARHGRWRPALKPACLVLLGFALVLVPWILRGALESGRVGSAGALGQTLVGRIVRHDEGFVIPDPESPTGETDPRKVDARRLILTQMGRDARPSAINHRLQEQLGLGEAEANSAMQGVAMEIFTTQPGRYVEGTLAKFRRLLVGEDERLRIHWSTRKDGELREDWLDERSIAHLYSPPSVVEESEYPIAEALTRIFQPHEWRALLIPLVLFGLGFGLIRGPRGPTALLLLTILALVFPSAALVGYVPRYRYPADPLLAILAGGGIAALVHVTAALRRRATRGRVHLPLVQQRPVTGP